MTKVTTRAEVKSLQAFKSFRTISSPTELRKWLKVRLTHVDLNYFTRTVQTRKFCVSSNQQSCCGCAVSFVPDSLYGTVQSDGCRPGGLPALSDTLGDASPWNKHQREHSKTERPPVASAGYLSQCHYAWIGFSILANDGDSVDCGR